MISALILNFRSPRDTRRCVDSLRAQTVTNDLEILVIDNKSDDESIQWLRNSFRTMTPQVRIVEHKANIGYGQGNVQALPYANGEFIYITNPDNELEPAGLERMMTLLKSDPTIGIIAPKLIHDDGTVRDSSRSFPHLIDVIAKRTVLKALFPGAIKRYLKSPPNDGQPHDVDWVVGACLLMRRSVFEEMGGFDPRYFLFFEDIDLCRRMWDRGLRVVYMPSVIAKDRKKRLSEGGLWALLSKPVGRIHIASALKYFWKWRSADLPAGRR